MATQKTHFSKIYSDMKDNLTLLKFPVWVQEAYTPVTMFEVDETGKKRIIPPIYQIDETNADSMCRARYSIQTIVDAIVNGFYLEFVNGGDIDTVKEWIRLYIDQVDATGVDVKTDVFYQNAKTVLGKLEGNLRMRKNWEAIKTPRKLSVLEILSAL